MQRLTKSQFLALELHKATPTVDIAHSEFCRHVDNEPFRFESWVTGYCHFRKDGIYLQVPWIAYGGEDSYEEAFEFDIQVQEAGSEFELGGFVLVDDSGNELTINKRDEFLTDILSGSNWPFWVSEKLPEPDPAELIAENIVANGGECAEYFVERDNDRPIRFQGTVFAFAESSSNPANDDAYSGSEGRWTELTLFKTKGGKFICQQVDCSIRTGERFRYKGQVCDTADQVMDFFGFGRLAKRLYDFAGFDPSLNVE